MQAIAGEQERGREQEREDGEELAGQENSERFGGRRRGRSPLDHAIRLGLWRGLEFLRKLLAGGEDRSVRRAPVSRRATSFYRTDCDATGSSSGGMHLARVEGRLVFRGITITSGPWRDENLRGAPYDERAGSVTTALGADAAILAAGKELAQKF